MLVCHSWHEGALASTRWKALDLSRLAAATNTQPRISPGNRKRYQQTMKRMKKRKARGILRDRGEPIDDFFIANLLDRYPMVARPTRVNLSNSAVTSKSLFPLILGTEVVLPFL